ncbi:DUF805 domain-containing protein [Ketogulonicigenium vulgare]|uniref:DUF805 domain-containing protein n=1 Tax=Ketogulonicigenium vulgare TaxID=92945 RepID=UPI00235977F7|nr:DUF805 domain-containing protein [Ketogulonicigenium vulgare]
MGLFDAIKAVLSKYATFSGRARRAEYWWWALTVSVIGIALSFVDQMLFPTTAIKMIEGLAVEVPSMHPIFTSIFWLLTIVPTLAVTIRRLHDVDRSGWWLLIWFVPLIGWIVLLIWQVRAGTSFENRFGPDPIGASERV